MILCSRLVVVILYLYHILKVLCTPPQLLRLVLIECEDSHFSQFSWWRVNNILDQISFLQISFLSECEASQNILRPPGSKIRYTFLVPSTPSTTVAKSNTMADSDRKKRKVKALPIEIAFLTDEDRAKFELALEIDSNPKSKTFGKEFLTAQSVRLPSSSSDEPAVNFDLKSLTVDHLRKLCTNIGIVNCGSHNKFNCR